MTVAFHIKGSNDKQIEAHVTDRGQLVTAPLSYSTMYSVTAAVNCTAVNIVPPITGKQFVITDIVLYANKGVGACDATVTLYEASSATSTVVAKSIITQEMVKKTNLPLIGLNIITTEGVWLNLKTDDNTVFGNIAGYYVKV